MGNCCSGEDLPNTEDPSHPPPPAPPLEEDDEHEYDPATIDADLNAATSTPFLGTPDVMAIEAEMQKNYLLRRMLSGRDQPTTSGGSSPVREEGKKKKMMMKACVFDPKLVSVLAFSRHLYERKKEVFRRVICAHEGRLVKVLNEIGEIEERIERPRPRMIQRSRSLGEDGDLNKGRFKVKTFNPEVGNPPDVKSGGGSGGDGKKPGGGSK